MVDKPLRGGSLTSRNGIPSRGKTLLGPTGTDFVNPLKEALGLSTHLLNGRFWTPKQKNLWS